MRQQCRRLSGDGAQEFRSHPPHATRAGDSGRRATLRKIEPLGQQRAWRLEHQLAEILLKAERVTARAVIECEVTGRESSAAAILLHDALTCELQADQKTVVVGA